MGNKTRIVAPGRLTRRRCEGWEPTRPGTQPPPPPSPSPSPSATATLSPVLRNAAADVIMAFAK